MRSLWKGPFINNSLLKEIYKSTIKKNSHLIKLKTTNCIIFPSFVNITFELYNGKKFVLLTVKEAMVGFRFGEFILTKKIAKHKKKINF